MRRLKSSPRQLGTTLDWDSGQQILPYMVDGRLEDVLKLFDLALDSISAGLEARRIVYPRNMRRGFNLNTAGPDHVTALNGVELFLKVITAGRPISKPRPKMDMFLIEEIEALCAADKADGLPAEQRQEARARVEQQFNRKWNSPESNNRATLPDLVAARRERIQGLLERVWKVLQDGFTSRQVAGSLPGSTGTPIDTGPDHRVRLRAANLLVNIVTLGRPVTPTQEGERNASIEELRQRWKNLQASRDFSAWDEPK